MKIILNSLFGLFLLSFNAFAQDGSTIQYIDCHFDDVTMEDRVIVSLIDAQRGTFFYSTGLDSEGEDRRTGKLEMTRIDDDATQPDQAQFKAIFHGDDYGKPITVEFGFSMPKAQIFQKSDGFSASVSSTSGYAGGLNCFSRLYPKE